MSLIFGLEYVLPVFVEKHEISVRRNGEISGKVTPEQSAPIVSSMPPTLSCSRIIAATGSRPVGFLSVALCHLAPFQVAFDRRW
jgi:hypothetical protein